VTLDDGLPETQPGQPAASALPIIIGAVVGVAVLAAGVWAGRAYSGCTAVKWWNECHRDTHTARALL
jgi:hypothetical protein